MFVYCTKCGNRFVTTKLENETRCANCKNSTHIKGLSQEQIQSGWW